jgi:ABC-type amino acid transport substrate-binding protein
LAKDISVINVAVSIDFPPFAFVEKGEIKGFDIDLLNAVASRLKKRIKYSPMKSNYVISAVASNLADLGAGGISIIKERQEYVDFTTPYFDSGFVLVIRKNYEDLDINQLKDKKIGTYMSDLTKSYMSTLNLGKNIIFGEYNFLFNELMGGAIDTVFVDYPHEKYMVSHNYKDH